MLDAVDAAKSGDLTAAVNAAVEEHAEEPIASERNEEGDRYDFDGEIQKSIVALMLRDSSFLARTHGLIEPDFFELEADGHLARMALDFYGKYRKAPERALLPSIIKDYAVKHRLNKNAELKSEFIARFGVMLKTDVSDTVYITEKVVEFAKDRAVGLAILASIEDKEKKDYAAIRARMQKALLVGANETSNIYDYFSEIKSRTNTRKGRIAGIIKRDGISTGYEEIDKELMHFGWGRKEMAVIMGPPKAGKSMSLGDFAKNAALLGYNVDYLSCEVSKDIIADRIDANISGVMMKKLDDNVIAVEDAITKMESGAGKLYLGEYAAGTLKPSAIRRRLEEHRANGVIIDLLVVDYADIMAPEFRTNDKIEDYKSIYIDLRAIAFDYNLAMLTATQTNRDGAKAMTATMTHVAEDFNRVRIADILLSINATEAEKAAGEARLFFAASRNGEGEFSIRIKQDRAKMRFIDKVMGRE